MAAWDVEATAEFSDWFSSLSRALRMDVAVKLRLLSETGPTLGRPHVDTVRGSAYPNMKELRVKRGQTRVFFAFDPRRVAILLIAGGKAGNNRFYEELVPRADGLYARHLERIGTA